MRRGFRRFSRPRSRVMVRNFFVESGADLVAAAGSFSVTDTVVVDYGSLLGGLLAVEHTVKQINLLRITYQSFVRAVPSSVSPSVSDDTIFNLFSEGWAIDDIDTASAPAHAGVPYLFGNEIAATGADTREYPNRIIYRRTAQLPAWLIPCGNCEFGNPDVLISAFQDIGPNNPGWTMPVSVVRRARIDATSGLVYHNELSNVGAAFHYSWSLIGNIAYTVSN